MIDKEKLEKLKKLADAMYYAAQYLTTDASRLHKAMDEYHKFIIRECKKEPKECMYSKDNYTDEDRKILCDGCKEECEFNKKEVSTSEDLSEAASIYQTFHRYATPFKAYIDGANWQKSKDAKLIINAKDDGYRLGLATMNQQMMAKAIDGEVTYGKSLAIPSLGYRLDKERLDFGDKVKVIVIKEY